MQISAVLFTISLGAYTAGLVIYLWALTTDTDSVRRMASVLVWLGLLAHTGAIVARGAALQRVPFVNLFESLMFVVWAMMAIYLLMERRYRITGLGAFACFVASVTIVCGSFLPKDVSRSLVPALRSHWSTVHIASSLIGYAGFTLSFGAVLGYALQKHLLKTKRVTALQRRLPSLDTMDHLAYRMVALGFPMFTLGIITGALWAQPAWGSYWSWDPKETWALITWLVYAAYLHVRIVQGRRGKWANRLLTVGFVCVLIAFLGVNFLPDGLHKYSW